MESTRSYHSFRFCHSNWRGSESLITYSPFAELETVIPPYQSQSPHPSPLAPPPLYPLLEWLDSYAHTYLLGRAGFLLFGLGTVIIQIHPRRPLSVVVRQVLIEREGERGGNKNVLRERRGRKIEERELGNDNVFMKENISRVGGEKRSVFVDDGKHLIHRIHLSSFDFPVPLSTPLFASVHSPDHVVTRHR